MDVAHQGLQPAFQMELADHEARHDRNAEAEQKVGYRDLPADEADQQHHHHLVYHRCGDQEREGDTERHPRRDETDEQRHRRARAERGQGAEACRQHVAHAFAFARKHGAGLFGRKEAANNAHRKHDQLSSSITLGTS
jgi:hypothetical protein